MYLDFTVPLAGLMEPSSAFRYGAPKNRTQNFGSAIAYPADPLVTPLGRTGRTPDIFQNDV